MKEFYDLEILSTRFTSFLIVLLVFGMWVSEFITAEAQPSDAQKSVTGEKPLQFRVKHTRDLLPEQARNVLDGAHGGFTIDRREGKGEIYFALKGAGLFRISADLTSVTGLNTPKELKQANLHNTTIWYDDSDAYLAFAANNKGNVFTTDLQGNLIHTLSAPSGDHNFDKEEVRSYFQGGGEFVPTDVEQVGGRYFITTGYSKLDYVLTGKVKEGSNDAAEINVNWGSLTFGGKGNKEEKGKFGTGHGITEGGHHLHVSDRKYAQLDRFETDGSYLSTLDLPEGSYPCDVDFSEGYSLVPCLHGPDREKGAPIYFMKDEEIVSTIMIKEDLGLKKFQHIHNAVLKRRNDRWYIIAQSWNPGDFAILEQVK